MARKRQVLNVPGVRHHAPIPGAVRIGNLFFSSVIAGQDPETRKLGEGPEQQAELAFKNLRLLLEEAGGTPDDVAHVSIFLKENRYREAVNKYWLEMFPDEDNRPARKAIEANLRGDVLLQLEVIAVLD